MAVCAQPHPGRWPAADLGSLDEALRAIGTWWATSPVPVELTVSAADLTLPRLADQVAAALLRAGLPATAVLVRLDREVLSTAADQVPTLIAALRSRGIPTAVDAYLPGPLTLARLRDLPVDRIRLDPAVTADVVADPRASLVVGHTVALARALGSTVHADSVDEHTDAVLARLGCQVLRAATGPLPADGLEQWLRHQAAPRGAVG